MNGMNQGRGQTISHAFVFLLLGVFALLSIMMVLISAQLYRDTVDRTELHGAQRILSSYVANVVRANDTRDMVYTDNRAGIDMLVFGWDVDGEIYETMVYCYEDTLRELFAAADQEFEPDYGEIICNVQEFEPIIDENGLLEVRLTDEQGVQSALHIALRCNQEGAE